MNATASRTTPESSEPHQAAAFSATLYAELQRIARGQMRQEASDHTLSATAVVNEAFLRLQHEGQAPAMEHTHFVRLAARVMRNVLVDHARSAKAQKRGGELAFTSMDQTAHAFHTRCAGQLFQATMGFETAVDRADINAAYELDFIHLDTALEQLRALSPRQAEVVDLRFFSDLSLEETAAALGVSLATVKRDWSVGRLFLQQAMQAARASEGDEP
jgi:RNA polymerase sigma-70 factor (ECF subfamily)